MCMQHDRFQRLGVFRPTRLCAWHAHFSWHMFMQHDRFQRLGAFRHDAAVRLALVSVTAGGQVTQICVRCKVLQCVAVCCSVLQCVAECCRVLQSAAVCCRVLQCVAAWCGALQRFPVCCIAWQCVTLGAEMGGGGLEWVAVCCICHSMSQGCPLIAGGAGTSNLYTSDHISESGLFRE